MRLKIRRTICPRFGKGRHVDAPYLVSASDRRWGKHTFLFLNLWWVKFVLYISEREAADE